jgi:hypothetical protein
MEIVSQSLDQIHVISLSGQLCGGHIAGVFSFVVVSP